MLQIVLFLLGVAAFICYAVMLVSFAMGIWDRNPQKFSFGLRFMVFAIILTIGFCQVLKYIMIPPGTPH